MLRKIGTNQVWISACFAACSSGALTLPHNSLYELDSAGCPKGEAPAESKSAFQLEKDQSDSNFFVRLGLPELRTLECWNMLNIRRCSRKILFFA